MEDNSIAEGKKSFFPQATSGLPHKDVGEMLTKLGQIGGVYDTHELLEASGILRDMARVSTLMSEAIEKFPLIVNNTIKTHLTELMDSQVANKNEMVASIEGLESTIVKLDNQLKETTALYKKELKAAKNVSRFYGFDVKSIVVGIATTTLILVPFSLLVLVPAMVKNENGSDWALKQYYNSPEGRQARAEFKLRCANTYPCKSKVQKK